MSDNSSVTDTELDTSLTSILGINGPLRIRPHNDTSIQKAHAILRRVESPEDSNGDGKESNTVYFRIFAHKNINLKPGRELLLTIASVDGQFKNRVVMFKGNLKGPDEDSDMSMTQVEEEPQVIEEEEEIVPEAVMPPKVRRQWIKKIEEVSPATFRPPVVHTSVGVQAQPVYISSSMQTISMQNSVSVQVQPSRSVASVQTRTSHISCAVQADPSPPPSYASSDVQTDPILPVLDLTGIHPTMNDEHTLQYTPARESHAMLTPPLSVEIPEPREPSEDMDMSPIGFEERERPIPGLTPSIRSLPHPRPEVKAENIFLPGLTQQPSSASPLRSLSRAKAEEIEHIRQQPSPVSDMFDLDDDPPDPPLRIPEPAPQNSFVSGGFVTDLIGAVTSPTKEGTSAGEEEGEILETDSAHPLNSPASHPPLLSPAQRKKKRQSVAANERRRKKRVRLAQAKLLAAGNPPLNDSDVATTSNVATPIDGVLEAQDEVTPAPSPPPPLIPAPPRPRGPTQNAVASSSKVVSTAPPPPPPLLHPGTNILPGVLNRMKQKAPANANQAIDLTSSPPPEPKAIARIPVGPSSNPLSIRPSNPPLQSTRPRPPPSTSTSTAVAATSKAKKKIVVGRGWPFVRAVGTSSSAAAALAPARSQPVASSSKVDLSSIMKYQSPSPPPVNKWKRIDDEISISVPPTDDDEAIRSLSPVPHPRPQVKAGDVSLPGIVHQPSSAPVNKWKRIDDRLRTPKPAPKNSFVSGGFVTDFIGAATLPTKEDPPIVQEEGPRLETDSPLNSPASDRSLLSPAQRKQKTQNEKRIDDDISIGVPPTDVDEAMDMVISEPPSPVSEPPPLPPPSSTDTSSSTSLADRISSPVPISLPVDIPLSAQPSSENVRSDSLLSRIFPPEIRPPTLPPSTPGQKVTGPAAHTASQNDSDSSGTKSNFEAPTPTAAFSVYHAPIPTAAFGVPSPQDHKQKRPALPPQIVTFAAANVSNNATATATKRAPPQLSVSQKNKGSVTMLPIHHSLPPKPPPPVALPRGTKRERPPSPDPRTASSIGIARVQDRRWPTIKVMHTDTLEGDGDLGIRQIAFNSDGSCFALYCPDRTLRIWRNEAPRREIARLAHSSQVVALAWLDDDDAVMTLAEDGVLGKWTRIQNQWQWGRIINVGLEAGLEIQKRAPEEVVCLAYARDKIAVAFPKSGVKVWMWHKGSWRAQRSIMRPNVTALKFIDGGDALLGGTREGVVWHCAVPNGTMKVYAFLQSSITSISTTHSRSGALVAQARGSACLLSLGAQDEQRVGQTFLASDVPTLSNNSSSSSRSGSNASQIESKLDAVYATYGRNVVFGAADGCLLVWDGTGGKGKGKGKEREREKAGGSGEGGVVCGLEWDGEWADGVGDAIQTVASCDDGQGNGCVVAGTRKGRLLWWPDPPVSPDPKSNLHSSGGDSHSSRKRAKVK